MNEHRRAGERQQDRVDRWRARRLESLASELGRHGLGTHLAWAPATEPCLIVSAPRHERIWCRAIAVRVEAGVPHYEWRFVWGDYHRANLGTYTHTVTDLPAAAAAIAAHVAGT